MSENYNNSGNVVQTQDNETAVKSIIIKNFKFLIKLFLFIFLIIILFGACHYLILKDHVTDRKGNENQKKWESKAGALPNSSSSISGRGGTVVEKAIECHKYLREHGFTYDMSYGKSIPDFIESSAKHVDCSTYVSWVLYCTGLDVYKGGQESNFKSNYEAGKHPELMEVQKNDIQPGDILLYDSHVEFAAKVENGKVTLVYNCGYNDAIKSEGTAEYPETSSAGSGDNYIYIFRVK